MRLGNLQPSLVPICRSDADMKHDIPDVHFYRSTAANLQYNLIGIFCKTTWSDSRLQ